MLKTIWGWLRLLSGRGPKKAPKSGGVEWDLIPFSFVTDWWEVSRPPTKLDASRLRVESDLRAHVPRGLEREEVKREISALAAQLEQSSYRLQQAIRLSERDPL